LRDTTINRGLSPIIRVPYYSRASPTTTAVYAHLTETTEQATSALLNRLVGSLRVDLRKL